MTETIHTCIENAERQVQTFSQRAQWTPLLVVISIFRMREYKPCGPRLTVSANHLHLLLS